MMNKKAEGFMYIIIIIVTIVIGLLIFWMINKIGDFYTP